MVQNKDFILGPTSINIPVEDEKDKKIAALEKRCDELERENQRINNENIELTVRLFEARKDNALLRKRLEPIEDWWERNCSEYIRKKHEKWDASMYEVIERCMELKEAE